MSRAYLTPLLFGTSLDWAKCVIDLVEKNSVMKLVTHFSFPFETMSDRDG